MRRLRPLLVLISLVALTASCVSDDTADDVSNAAVSAPAEAPAADEDPEPGATTAATLERMRSMDPAVLARAHDHSDHEHEGHHAPRDHPNGVDPERLVIPAIDVDADVLRLGLEDDGAMEVPQDFAQAGWFDRGPKPGRVGPAVIAGHVDDRSGPAVFFRLSELEPGDLIEVHGEDGEIVTFAVRETQQHPKDAFPTEAVYSGTPGSELRLITCSGEFDRGERSYRDNTIVFAERVD
ncbi:class F sortase [Nitriliruptor alkaliphilus]|uniref:class F sortase n=1 Tax=Nitriliruptor alkaliphilus TaxID=427918 RepID=UPI0009FB1D97|nr:class F sortase [Nitriliruptor alkaliphilus]